MDGTKKSVMQEKEILFQQINKIAIFHNIFLIILYSGRKGKFIPEKLKIQIVTVNAPHSPWWESPSSIWCGPLGECPDCFADARPTRLLPKACQIPGIHRQMEAARQPIFEFLEANWKQKND